MTIRLRLTLLYSSLLVIIIVIFGLAVFGIMDRTLRWQADTSLARRLDEIERSIRNSISPDGRMLQTPYTELSFRSAGIFVQFWQPNENHPSYWSPSLGTYHAPLDADGLSETTETYSNVNIGDVNFRVITRPIYQNSKLVGHLQGASSLETIQSATDRLLIIMLLASLGALVLAFTWGYGLASRAMYPLTQIAETAQTIVAADDLARRIPTPTTQDELGSLINTINQMLERLEKVFTTQQQFVADISHELRTPVTAIQGNIEIIKRFGNDPASVQAIEKEAQRMARLIGDLLMLARVEVGQLPLMKTQVELDTLLLEIYNQARLLSQDRLKITLGDFEHIVIDADSDRLKQLLLNLITNALKYTPDGGIVALNMRRLDTDAEITVSDTGIGIPPDDLPHIFDRFYRVDKARSRNEGGAGLGLSIAQWIAEAHGGQLSVQSKLGKGSTFTLHLPLSSTAAPTPATSAKSPPSPRRLGRLN